MIFGVLLRHLRKIWVVETTAYLHTFFIGQKDGTAALQTNSDSFTPKTQ